MVSSSVGLDLPRVAFRATSVTKMTTRAALCLAPILRMSLSLGKIYHALICQVEAFEGSWIERAEQPPMFLLATSTLFSRTSDFSPDEVKALPDSGSSNVDSGHPAGTQPDGHQQFPVPVMGGVAAAQRPLQGGDLGHSSCSSHVVMLVHPAGLL